eukprot:784886-Prorocentrum_minimum.AAC.6
MWACRTAVNLGSSRERVLNFRRAEETSCIVFQTPCVFVTFNHQPWPGSFRPRTGLFGSNELVWQYATHVEVRSIALHPTHPVRLRPTIGV